MQALDDPAIAGQDECVTRPLEALACEIQGRNQSGSVVDHQVLRVILHHWIPVPVNASARLLEMAPELFQLVPPTLRVGSHEHVDSHSARDGCRQLGEDVDVVTPKQGERDSALGSANQLEDGRLALSRRVYEAIGWL
jgi:hypothetical protein